MVGQALSRVIAGLVRRTWLLGLTTVLVCAGFAAHAVASILEARYLETLPRAPLAAPPPVAPVVVVPTPDGGALVTRNMFCSTCGPVITGGSGQPIGFVPAAELIATSIGSIQIATVRVPASEVQGDWTIGEVIPGIGTVDRIGFSSIDVRDADGRTGTLSLLPVPSGGRSDVGAATPDPAAAATPFADRIRKIDDTTFEVERTLVRDLVSGSMQQAGARITPITKDGKLDGLRMFGVKPTGLAGALGLQNGDVLQAVNNTKIESANTLLGLYAGLDTLDTVEIAGTRKGKPFTLNLRLR